MKKGSFKNIAIKARKAFETTKIDRSILKELYAQYHPVRNIDVFINRATSFFPNLNCGVASVYLKYMLGRGNIVNGNYSNNNHTFLLLNKKTIVDITADQYGGPKIYVGPLKNPWSLRSLEKKSRVRLRSLC